MGKQRLLLADVMATVGIAAMYRAHVLPWMYTRGARVDELTATLPGDELVDPEAPRTTRAVTIDAPRHDVWPWLVQIGEDRGGFYSYSLIERLSIIGGASDAQDAVGGLLGVRPLAVAKIVETLKASGIDLAAMLNRSPQVTADHNSDPADAS